MSFYEVFRQSNWDVPCKQFVEKHRDEKRVEKRYREEDDGCCDQRPKECDVENPPPTLLVTLAAYDKSEAFAPEHVLPFTAFDGLPCSSVKEFYVRAKTFFFRECMDDGDTIARFARKWRYRSDMCIYDACQRKFRQHPHLAQLLASTRGVPLAERNVDGTVSSYAWMDTVSSYDAILVKLRASLAKQMGVTSDVRLRGHTKVLRVFGGV